MATDAPATSLLRPLAEDLRARREQIKLGGGEEKIAAQHEREKLTARERIALLIDEGTFVELGIHGRPHFSQRAMEGREAPADGVITGYGKVDGRLAAVAAYDFTVMAGSMGMTGEMKVARLRELALTQADPDDLAAGLGRRADPGGGRLAVRRFGRAVPRGGRDERRGAAGRGADGTVRGGHGLHPRPRRLRPDGQGPRLDGAGRPAPGACRGRRGRHPGGARRLTVHCRKSGVGDLEVADDPECIERDQAVPELLPRELRGGAAGRARAAIRSTAATRSCSTSCPSPTASPTTCTR